MHPWQAEQVLSSSESYSPSLRDAELSAWKPSATDMFSVRAEEGNLERVSKAKAQLMSSLSQGLGRKMRSVTARTLHK